MLASTLIRAVCRSFGSTAPASRGVPQSQNTDTIKSLADLRDEYRPVDQHVASTVADAKLSELASLAATPYLVQDNATLCQSIATLERATTISQVQQAKEKLLKAMEHSHQQLFVQAVTLACTKASLKVGFSSVETMPSVVENTVRVVATDSAGRALVTEINADPRHEPSIETEVVGVSDGSCNQILDAFDLALEEAGVRSRPPSRKFTGGVCELAAARDFVRRKVRRSAGAQQNLQTPDASATRRRQRFNQPSRIKQR